MFPVQLNSADIIKLWNLEKLSFLTWSKDQLSFMKAIQKRKLLYIYSICYMNIFSLMRKQSFCGSSKKIKPFSFSKNYWSVFSEFQNVLVYLGHIVGFKEFNFYTLVENSKNTSKQLYPFSDLEYFTSIRYTDMDKRRQKTRKVIILGLSLAQFSCVNFLRPHGLQHARPPCPSPTPEFTQTRIHWVGVAIQPSHPLSSTSPPTINLSQHQGLFKWVSSLHQVAEILEFHLQHQCKIFYL